VHFGISDFRHKLSTSGRNPPPNTISSAESAAPPSSSSANVPEKPHSAQQPSASELPGLAPTPRQRIPAGNHRLAGFARTLSMFRHSAPKRSPKSMVCRPSSTRRGSFRGRHLAMCSVFPARVAKSSPLEQAQPFLPGGRYRPGDADSNRRSCLKRAPSPSGRPRSTETIVRISAATQSASLRFGVDGDTSSSWASINFFLRARTTGYGVGTSAVCSHRPSGAGRLRSRPSEKVFSTAAWLDR